MPFDAGALNSLIDSYGCDPVQIIAMLQNIQEQYGYLPREAFRILSQRLRMSEARIYSIATFYENFSLEPKGKYVIRVCDGTAYHVRKSIPIRLPKPHRHSDCSRRPLKRDSE